MNAFPLATADNVHSDGMTLRDYFAAQAMAAMLIDYREWSRNDDAPEKMVGEQISNQAYGMADLMLLERDK